MYIFVTYIMKKLVYILTSLSLLLPQTIYEEIINLDNGDSDTFAYQIPDNYNENQSHPLLVAFHQWGGNHMSTFSTQFDEEANSRNWIFLSPNGGSSNNYNHQNAQLMVLEEIKWIQERYNIDKTRIYMVGGSMGGAAGAIFANKQTLLNAITDAIGTSGKMSVQEWASIGKALGIYTDKI